MDQSPDLASDLAEVF
jgi:CRP-like cAMP-binding protein